MPQNYGIALLITFFAGLATAIGAGIAFIVKRDNMKALSIGLGFSAGVMIFYHSLILCLQPLKCLSLFSA